MLKQGLMSVADGTTQFHYCFRAHTFVMEPAFVIEFIEEITRVGDGIFVPVRERNLATGRVLDLAEQGLIPARLRALLERRDLRVGETEDRLELGAEVGSGRFLAHDAGDRKQN